MLEIIAELFAAAIEAVIAILMGRRSGKWIALIVLLIVVGIGVYLFFW